MMVCVSPYLLHLLLIFCSQLKPLDFVCDILQEELSESLLLQKRRLVCYFRES